MSTTSTARSDISWNKSRVKSVKLKQDVQYLRWFIIKVIIDWYVYTYYGVVTIATHRVMRRLHSVLLCYSGSLRWDLSLERTMRRYEITNQCTRWTNLEFLPD